MNRRSTSSHVAYTTEEINEFLDRITDQVETLVMDVNNKNKEITSRDEKIHRMAMELDELQRKLKHYESIEEELSKTQQIAIEETKKIEEKKEELMLEAKKNADRIVNEALLAAEKTEMEANLLRKDIKQLKDKIKNATKI